MAEIGIRIAQRSDLDALVDLNFGLVQEDAGQRDPFANLNWSLDEGHDYFGQHIDAMTSLCLIAESGGCPVGYLVGYTRVPNSLRPIATAVLESIFVRREIRSTGIGEQLVGQFVDWCDARQVMRVSVSAYAANTGAVRFYERLGFVPRLLTFERPVRRD